jgi:hypothetical protein
MSPSSFAAHAQRVSDSINVVEPGSDESDLQDGLIVKTGFAQTLVIGAADLGGVLRHLDDVLHHHALLRGERGLGVIGLQRPNEFFIQGDSTQKLCVRLDSINAPVGDRHHGGDNLVLTSAERQLRGHQHSEGGEGVVKGLGNQGV